MALVVLFFGGVISPKDSLASCEFGTISPAGSAIEAAQTLQIEAMVLAFETNATLTGIATTDYLMLRLEEFDEEVRDTFHDFWDAWRGGLRAMTAEISTAMLEQERVLGTFMDSRMQSETQKKLQEEELAARRMYQPSEQACVVDSINPDYGFAMKISKAVQRGYERDYTNILTNRTGTASGSGAATVLAEKWNDYSNIFCDPEGNNGQAACGTVPPINPYANMDISVSRTILSQDTVDLADPNIRRGAQRLIENMIGFEPPNPLPQATLSGTAGRQALLQRRSNMAKYNAVASVFSEVLGERTPLGHNAPEVEALRNVVGSVAGVSAQPSKYEIRQAISEHLWDPKYYRDLQDGSNTALQKQVHLQAYSLMMLDDLIAKTEKIALLYAIQLGNKLDQIAVMGETSGAPNQ